MAYQTDAPTQIVDDKKNNDVSIELRINAIAGVKVVRARQQPGQGRYQEVKGSKAKAMINKSGGVRRYEPGRQGTQRRTRDQTAAASAIQMMNLPSKSG